MTSPEMLAANLQGVFSYILHFDGRLGHHSTAAYKKFPANTLTSEAQGDITRDARCKIGEGLLFFKKCSRKEGHRFRKGSCSQLSLRSTAMEVSGDVARKCALRGRKELPSERNPLGGGPEPSGQAHPSMMPRAHLPQPSMMPRARLLKPQ
jgi:hypothetical protein